MKRTFFIIYIVLFFLTSCGASQKMPVEFVADSTKVVIQEKVILKDTTIYVEVPVEVERVVLPASDTSRLETSLAYSEAWLAEGQLHHNLRHKDHVALPKVITIPSYIRNETTTSNLQKVIIKEVEVEKQLNWWQNITISLGTIVFIVIVICGIIKAVKAFIV